MISHGLIEKRLLLILDVRKGLKGVNNVNKLRI